jgi:hypothetical protein
MRFESERSSRPFGARSRFVESVAEHRTRLALEHEERQQRRLEAFAGQTSFANDPSERIRIWERLHGLDLPRNPTHNLLSVIAAATELQLEQVREVQRLRLSVVHDGGISGASPE